MTTFKKTDRLAGSTLLNIDDFINNEKFIKLVESTSYFDAKNYAIALKDIKDAQLKPKNGMTAKAKESLKKFEVGIGKNALDNVKALKSICEKEVNRLAVAYGDATVIKYCSDYRKAICSRFGKENPAQFFFSAGRKVKKRNDKYDETLLNATPRRFPKEKIDDLVALAKVCIKSDGYAKKTLGLMALTGRRPIEILQKGTFEDCGKDGWVKFFGQAKSSREDGFDIPVLGGLSANELMAVVKEIRLEKDFEGWDAEKVHSGTSKWLGQIVKRNFNRLLGPEVIVYDLRGLWCAVAEYKFRDSLKSMTLMTFYQTMLGHSDTNKGSKSERPYMKFEIV